MILGGPELLLERRAGIERSADLRALADRMGSLLAPLIERPLWLPSEKAMLSRDGGVCPTDGARLVFDPWSPHAHRCPACSESFEGERHHRAWIWRYHLWLSERAIHLALLAHLFDRPTFSERAAEILEAYADLYPRIPNKDNVLGPTRLFFSTYLESLWLTQIAVAASLLGHRGGTDVRSSVEPMVRESAELVASFDEGVLNRQVWNDVAMIAAGRWLDDRRLVERGLDGRHGLRSQLSRGVTADGLWYEGENYHFFALRGFLLGAELMRGMGLDLYESGDLGARLRSMYVAPLETAFPDLTLPARGDAPFGVSLRQARFAELFEIGWRRTGDDRLAAVLADLYGVDLPDAGDAGANDIAEQERNIAPGRLSRSGLSWKSLLIMTPTSPEAGERWHPQSLRVLEEAGVTVLRPTPDRYVSVEAGGAPGGHGHPDQLHVTLYCGGLALGDFGTGSYVNPSLHWYRSTAAHNAPGVRVGGQGGQGGQLLHPNSQQFGRDAWCSAADVKGEWAWCRVVARDLLGRGTRCARIVVTCDAYTLDVVEVEVPRGTVVDLPLHTIAGVGLAEPDGPPTRLRLEGDHHAMELHLCSRKGETMAMVTAPGPPSLFMADGVPTRYLVRTASGSGTWVQVYAHDVGAVSGVEIEGGAVAVTREDGTVDRFTYAEQRMRIRSPQGTVTLEGARPAPSPRPMPMPRRPPMVVQCVRLRSIPEPSGEWQELPLVFLAESHYRRSESAYGDRGPFEAAVGTFHVSDRVGFAVRVVKTDLTFRSSDELDPALDNECPDIHSDGVQFYLGLEAWEGYLAVPQVGTDRAHVRAIEGTIADASRVEARWTRTDQGYVVVMTVRIDRPLTRGAQFPVQVVVNEMYSDRERRAGQLVLSGGPGTVYLRGDREDPTNAAVAEVQ